MVLATGVWMSGLRLHSLTATDISPSLFSVRLLLIHLLAGLLLVPWTLTTAAWLKSRRQQTRNPLPVHDRSLLLPAAVMTASGIILFAASDTEWGVLIPVAWWLHILLPFAGLVVWWRRQQSAAGQSTAGVRAVTVLTAACLALLGLLPFEQSPQQPSATTNHDNTDTPFAPSPARTSSGQTIAANHLNNSDDCMTCHQDVHSGWLQSAHRFSSFNNPAYLASFTETRRITAERGEDGTALRWCAGCHDPVPLLSGRLDEPDFDVLHDPTADAGITCTVCHGITHVNGTQGNGAYTIAQPQEYPFADSSSFLLQWIRRQLIRTRPEFHRHTYLKDIHSQAEFCAACHKVHVPFELNRYREFLRGQNHYDSWLLSGISGHSARSFYYPETAEQNCNGCHMQEETITDSVAHGQLDDIDRGVHSHLFAAANTALPSLHNRPDTLATHQSFLQSAVDVDVFGIRDGDGIDSPLTAPLRPRQLALQPGHTYLLETVIRTLDVGHHFTQGTADSNQVWLEVTVSSDDQLIAASGLPNREQRIDPQAHFVNVFMLDRHGHRIDRRNVHDIFVPLYDHQIPPGAAQTVHYRLTIPENTVGRLTVTARLLYRKFDSRYFEFIAASMQQLGRPLSPNPDGVNPLPVTVLAEDSVTLPVQGNDSAAADSAGRQPAWRRWNDYGIGLLLKGPAELRQAAHAFQQVEQLGRYDGPLNLARTLITEGGDEPLQQASAALQRAATHHDPPAPPWTLLWLQGLISRQQGDLETAEQLFRQVLTMETEETQRRGFDFSRDYIVNNLLGQTVFDRAVRTQQDTEAELRRQRLNDAVDIFQRTLQLDQENADAHHNLAQLYQLLEMPEPASRHREKHARYRPDDTARGLALEAARRRYPHAGAASEPIVIYTLRPVSSAAP